MSEQASHPIVLQQVVFTRCSVNAIPGHVPSPDVATAVPENEIRVARNPENQNEYQATMRTLVNSSQDKGSPYCIDVEAIAVLTADNSLTDAEASRGIMITAHSVLYGAIRETVSWLTGRQPYGTLTLGLSVLRSPTPAEPPKP